MNSRSILVVEDDEDVRRILALVLELAGYKVLQAETGRQAFERLRTSDVSIVVTDLRVPDGGLGLLEAMRDARPECPLLVVSGAPDEGIARRGFPYLKKPFQPETLLAEIGKLLEDAENRKRSATPVSR